MSSHESIERLRRGMHAFDKYGIAMSALVAPNEYCLFDDARSHVHRLATIKQIAITGLREVVLLARQGSIPQITFAMDVSEGYYLDKMAERLAEPVKLFRPNPLLMPSMSERISKGRYQRIHVVDLLADLTPHSDFDEAIAADLGAVRKYIRESK